MIESSDKMLGKVLAGLRDVTAPPGMERRIVQALDTRAKAPQASEWPAPYAISAVAGCALLAACFAILTRVAPPAGHDLAVHHDATKQPVPPLASVAPVHVVHLARNSVLVRTAAITSMPTEMTVSYPTPPLPLTDQERLLLRVAHRRDPANIAILNPAARDTEIATEQKQFDIFFAPPPRIQAEAPIPNEMPHEVKDEGSSR